LWDIFKKDEPIPLLSWVVNKAPIVIWAIDNDGIFITSEGKSLESLDLKPGEARGKSVFEVYADHPEILEDIRKALTGEQITTEVCIKGNYFEVEYIPVFDEVLNVVGAVGVALEVTRRKKAEQSLKRYLSLY